MEFRLVPQTCHPIDVSHTWNYPPLPKPQYTSQKPQGSHTNATETHNANHIKNNLIQGPSSSIRAEILHSACGLCLLIGLIYTYICTSCNRISCCHKFSNVFALYSITWYTVLLMEGNFVIKISAFGFKRKIIE